MVPTRGYFDAVRPKPTSDRPAVEQEVESSAERPGAPTRRLGEALEPHLMSALLGRPASYSDLVLGGVSGFPG
jgi:hypothetical protein